MVSCPLSHLSWRRELWSHREGFRRKDKPVVEFVCVTVQVVGSTVVNTTLISILYEVRVEMAPSVWRRQRWLARTKGRSWRSHPLDQENAVGGKLCLWMKKILRWVPENHHICPMVHAHTHTDPYVFQFCLPMTINQPWKYPYPLMKLHSPKNFSLHTHLPSDNAYEPCEMKR